MHTLRYQLFLLPAFLLLHFHASLAQSVFEFEKKEIDLGYMPEDTGNVVVDFRFRNASKTMAIIQEIDTHGGCHIIHYPKDSLAPDAAEKITVRINPRNRPGPFVRRVTLRSLPDSAVYDLYIKSYVEPAAKVWDQNTNETSYGKLVLSSDYIRFGNVSENSKVEKSIKLKNTGTVPIRLVASKFKKPAYVTIKGCPDKLLPDQEATVIFAVDFASSKMLGSYTDLVELYADPANPKEVIVYLIGKIAPVPVASATKPVVDMLLREADLKEIPSDKPAEGSFVIKNTGNAPLVIRKVETSCTCLSMEKSADVPAGASANLYFTFDPRGLKGWEEKKIFLYTNAPDQPIITLLVKAKVDH